MNKIKLITFMSSLMLSGNLIANPIRTLGQMIDESFDDTEQEFFSNSFYMPRFSGFPATNIIDEDKNLVVEMQVPGFKKEQINIQVEPRKLKVSAKKEIKKEETATKYFRKESSVDSFVKELSLPIEVDLEKVTSSIQDGILKIVLPKKENTSKSKTVTITEANDSK